MNLTKRHEECISEIRSKLSELFEDSAAIEEVIHAVSYEEEDAEEMLEYLSDPDEILNSEGIFGLAYAILEDRDPENA